MDPITTAIIAALASLAEPAVKDAYESLKELIVKKLGLHHGAVVAVGELEKNPKSDGRRATLGEEFAVSDAAKDAAIVAAAEKLLDQVRRAPGGPEIIRQTVTGDRNIFTVKGDIHIGGTPP